MSRYNFRHRIPAEKLQSFYRASVILLSFASSSFAFSFVCEGSLKSGTLTTFANKVFKPVQLTARHTYRNSLNLQLFVLNAGQAANHPLRCLRRSAAFDLSNRAKSRKSNQPIHLNLADDSNSAQASNAVNSDEQDEGNYDTRTTPRRFASPTFLVQEMVTDDGLALSGSILRVARSNWVSFCYTM